VALLEASNVSVGRGTDSPFELFGASFIDSRRLAEYLQERRIDGVRFEAATFTPRSDIYKSHLCRGVRITVTDRLAMDAGILGVEILSALHRLYPSVFQLQKALHLLGSRAALQAIEERKDPRDVAASWQGPLDEFCRLRSGYLLYED
jgi:uncharacterized protein YbbC (DUF1343 family)